MKSFSDCLKKHGLDKFERDLLTTRREALLEGKEAADGHQAALMAVNAYESDLLDQRDAIHKAIGLDVTKRDTSAAAGDVAATLAAGAMAGAPVKQDGFLRAETDALVKVKPIAMRAGVDIGDEVTKAIAFFRGREKPTARDAKAFSKRADAVEAESPEAAKALRAIADAIAPPKPAKTPKEKTPEQLAAIAAKTLEKRQKAKEARIAALGEGIVNGRTVKRMFQRLGIDIEERSDITGERGAGSNKTGAMVGTFRADGMKLDDWGQRLVDEGWLQPESQSEVGNENIRASMDDVRDFMRRVFNGEAIFKAGDTAPMQAAAEAAAADDLSREDVAGILAETQEFPADRVLEAFDLDAEARAAGITDEGIIDDIGERAALRADNGENYEEAARSEIESRANESDSASDQQVSEGPEALDLTGQTPEELKASEEKAAADAAAAAKAEASAAEKEKAKRVRAEVRQRSEAAAGTFELGGNAEDNLSGQGGLLLKPSESPELTAAREDFGNAMDRQTRALAAAGVPEAQWDAAFEKALAAYGGDQNDPAILRKQADALREDAKRFEASDVTQTRRLNETASAIAKADAQEAIFDASRSVRDLIIDNNGGDYRRGYDKVLQTLANAPRQIRQAVQAIFDDALSSNKSLVAGGYFKARSPMARMLAVMAAQVANGKLVNDGVNATIAANGSKRTLTTQWGSFELERKNAFDKSWSLAYRLPAVPAPARKLESLTRKQPWQDRYYIQEKDGGFRVASNKNLNPISPQFNTEAEAEKWAEEFYAAGEFGSLNKIDLSEPDPAKRLALTARIEEIGRLMIEGKVGIARIKIGQLIEAKTLANERAAEKRSGPRQRGPLWIKERLIRAFRNGELDRRQVSLALWLLRQNPAIADDLAISIKSKFTEGTAGQYNPFSRIVTLVTGRGDETTAAHEILHHAERLMPPSVQQGIRDAWARDLTDFESWAQGLNLPDLGEVVADVLRFQSGDKEAGIRIRNKLLNGELPESFYRLTSPSEYWAEHAAELVVERADAKGWVSEARQWLREFIEKIKSLFGLPSTAAIIRGLNSVLSGNGEYRSNLMLGQVTAGALERSQQGVLESLNIPIFTAADGIMGRIKQEVLDRFAYEGKSLSWINKTINTQFHLAETNAYYRPIYQGVQRYIGDVNSFANAAAELAGENILPRMLDLSDVWFNPFKFSNWQKERQLQRDLRSAGQVMWAGTLADIRPTDAQLASGFNAVVRDSGGNAIGDVVAPPLTAPQIEHYRKIRASIDLSLDIGAASEMVKIVRESLIDRRLMAAEMGRATQAGQTITKVEDARQAAKNDPENAAAVLTAALQERLEVIEEMRGLEAVSQLDADALKSTTELMIAGVKEKEEMVQKLKDEGYVPLMRFGQYTIKVVEPNEVLGTENVLYFGMFESVKDANRTGRDMLAELLAEHPNATLVKGTMDTEAWKNMRGLSLDTLEAFAKMTGMDKDAAVQDFIKMAVSSRSAMKRLIARKGIKGYDEDIQRVLATFVTSQARLASRNYHFGELLTTTKAIPQSMGDVITQAATLTKYIQNPTEEAQGIRGFLFTQMIGGSIASALTNITGPILTTLPYLSQFEPGTGFSGAFKAPAAAATAMSKALRVIANKGTADADLKKAMARAATEGKTEPQEIHQMYAESIRSGIGGRNLQARKALRLWSSMFSLAESFNRNLTFIAAFELARQPGAMQVINAKRADKGRSTFVSPYDFAVHAIDETQFVYNKGNRPVWARGGIGATVFTFKQFSISYVEFLSRLPAREKAIALAILVMAAGVEGLPFEDDLVDLWDTIWQAMGFASNAKKSIRGWAVKTLGEAGGGFLTGGLSGIPGSPIDVSGRLGVGNLIPGSSIFVRSTQDATREVAEAVGPVGSVIMSARQAFSAAEEGQFKSAAYNVVPKAIRDAMQAADMYQTGYYRDLKGRRTIETTGVDAAFKAIGLMPHDVSAEAKHRQDIQQDIALHNVVEASIADRWARGVFENDPDEVQAAIKDLFSWNLRNPNSPISISPQQIRQRVQSALMPAEARLRRQTPSELRGQEFR